MKRYLALLLLFVAIPAFGQRPVKSSGGVLSVPVDQDVNFQTVATENISSVTLVTTSATPNNKQISLVFTQDATGGRTVVFGGNLTTTCSITTTANATTICRWQYNSSANSWGDTVAITGGAAALAGNLNSIYLSPACPNPSSGNCFFAKFDVKMCFDGTVTNGSPNIASAGQCQFVAADVGKKIFVTSLCSGAVCGFGQGTTAITILPSTQVTVATIGTVTDATHVIAACTSPGNCASPNASSSGTAGSAVIVYGSDDTTSLNAAWNAALLFAGCATLHLPSGAAFFNDKIFFNKTPSTVCQNADNIHTLSQVALLAYSLTVQGEGHGNTYLIPTPDFVYADCSPACIGGGAQGVLWRDLSISGFGQSLLGAGIATGGALFSVSGGNGGGGLMHVDFSHWASRNSPQINGIIVPQYSQLSNVDCTNFGGYCATSAGNQNISVENSHFGGGGFGCWFQAGGGIVNSANNIWDGPTQGNNCMDIAGQFNSANDRLEPITGVSGGNDVVVRSGGVLTATNFTDNSGVAASLTLQVLSGGTAKLLNWRATVAHTTAISNAGTLIDLGGNSFNGALINTAATAVWRADGHSVMGACTGVVTASSTLGLFGTGPNVTLTTCTSTTIGSGTVMQASGTLRNLTVTATAAGVNGSSGVVTVLKNGATQTITCTLGTTTFCNDPTNTVAYVAGDLISLQFTTQAADTLAGVKAYVVEF